MAQALAGNVAGKGWLQTLVAKSSGWKTAVRCIQDTLLGVVLSSDVATNLLFVYLSVVMLFVQEEVATESLFEMLTNLAQDRDWVCKRLRRPGSKCLRIATANITAWRSGLACFKEGGFAGIDVIGLQEHRFNGGRKHPTRKAHFGKFGMEIPDQSRQERCEVNQRRSGTRVCTLVFR
jgi:hypothetical protein